MCSLFQFLNPKQRTVFNETLDNLILKYKKAFKDLDLEKSYEGLFQLLWHSTSPCFDIQNWTSSYRDQRSSIKQCMWKGVNVIKLYFLATNQLFPQVMCSRVFKTNPTDRGMCCTFNALAAEEIYRESKFSKIVTKLQKENALGSFDAPHASPFGFENKNEPFPEIG